MEVRERKTNILRSTCDQTNIMTRRVREIEGKQNIIWKVKYD
jgi:hypothetical protein